MTTSSNRDQASRRRGSVEIRPMVWADMPDLVGTFDATWKVQEDPEGTVSRLSAAHFILHYLVGATRARIAVDGQDFLGVTLLAEGHGEPCFPKAEEELEQVDQQLSATTLGAQTLDRARQWQLTEVRLEKQCGLAVPPQAELRLFLVSSRARGRGVGGALWRDTLEHLDQAGIGRFYLHTDSSCDVGFYDHQGMERLAELKGRDHAAFAGRDPSDDPQFFEGIDDIFIYGGRVSDQLGKDGDHGGR
ncbi:MULTISPECIES: GNAT family N-acetyltransferase [Bifidobacterium]|uniref:GNAT family N-acetyltransferase n=1 Tax=Bifidobacterium TaxID=1678 RepID=UPI0018DC93D4|nr:MULTISPECIES: GNAT family N-acetyltransferase [Bifidobacterium]MBI0144758.1 GNAT family N-acetyltransferase [Bifidobacterium polysaccharolyticum]MBI0151580.1 GNAT family N-acetyltransferase [Bifidobacterium sp. M0399]